MIRRPLRSTRSVTLLPYSTLFRTLHISYTDAQLLRYLPITQFFNTMSQIYLFRPGRKAVDSQTVTLPHLVQLRRCVWPGHFLAGCADHGVQRPGLGPAPHTVGEEMPPDPVQIRAGMAPGGGRSRCSPPGEGPPPHVAPIRSKPHP